MKSPEPLRGSVRPEGHPARLLGDEEVDSLIAMQNDNDEAEDEETDDDRRPH